MQVIGLVGRLVIHKSIIVEDVEQILVGEVFTILKSNEFKRLIRSYLSALLPEIFILKSPKSRILQILRLKMKRRPSFRYSRKAVVEALGDLYIPITVNSKSWELKKYILNSNSVSCRMPGHSSFSP